MIQVNLPCLSDDAADYLHKCARIRHISCCRLIERVMRAVCEDQLVLSILDDDSRPEQHKRGEVTKSHYRKQVGMS